MPRQCACRLNWYWPLLLVLFDDGCRPHFGVIRILAEFAERTTLAQKIPTVIQLDLECLDTRERVVVHRLGGVHSLLLHAELRDLLQARDICGFCHVRPPSTAYRSPRESDESDAVSSRAGPRPLRPSDP